MGFTSSASDMLPSIPPCIAYIADLEVIYGTDFFKAFLISLRHAAIDSTVHYIADLEVIYGTHFFKTFLISLGHATINPTMHYIADLDIGLKQFFFFKVVLICPRQLSTVVAVHS